MGEFYGNRMMQKGIRGVLIEPLLDDPCTALCVHDTRATTGHRFSPG
jgi:hypothetical protein